jgi:uncharacterized repeat protein (TIGR02543 family)/uncharacterized repeat protein (TIGR01451 family)
LKYHYFILFAFSPKELVAVKNHKAWKVLLLVMVWGFLALPVVAGAASGMQDGIVLTLNTDKSSYAAGDTVRVTATVENTNAFSVDNVVVNVALPDGLTLISGATSANVGTLASAEAATLQLATKASDAKSAEATGTVDTSKTTPKTADDSSILVWLALAGFSVACITLAIVSRKKNAMARFLIVLFCCALMLSSVTTLAFGVSPGLNRGSFSVSTLAKIINVDKTFSATVSYQWQMPIEDVTISFDANAGTSAPTSQTVAMGSQVTLSNTIPTRAGFNFLGWAKSHDALIATYQPGDTVTVTGNITLFAVWEPIVYTATIDVIHRDADDESIIKQDTFTVSPGAYGPYLAQVFAGYGIGTLAPGSAPAFGLANSGQSITITYEYQKTPVFVTLAYDANGGLTAPISETVPKGSFATISATIPTRSGYTFLGWALSSSATTADYQPGDTILMDGDKTLHAIWEVVGHATIVVLHMDSTNGSLLDSYVHTVSPGPYGPYYPESYPGFGEGTLDSASSPSSGIIAPNETLTIFYRYWVIPVGDVTLTFDANGGSGAPPAQTVPVNTQVQISGSLPTRFGYYCIGWSEDSTATSADYGYGQFILLDGNKTLYAVWRIIM